MATHKPPEDLIKYWIAASEQEFGIEIRVVPEDQHKFVQDLYQARQHFGGFEDLMLAQVQPEGTVFIIKQSTELPE